MIDDFQDLESLNLGIIQYTNICFFIDIGLYFSKLIIISFLLHVL